MSAQDEARGTEIHVTMPDGSVWAVDAQIVSREFGGRAPILDVLSSEDDKVLRWASENLNWADVSATARLVSLGNVDFQAGWMSGAKKIVYPTHASASAGV